MGRRLSVPARLSRSRERFVWSAPGFARKAASNSDRPALISIDDDSFLSRLVEGVKASYEKAEPGERPLHWFADAWPAMNAWRDWGEVPEAWDTPGSSGLLGALNRARDARFDELRQTLGDAHQDWVRKLYLPIHQFYNVVVADLSCEHLDPLNGDRYRPFVDPRRIVESGVEIQRLSKRFRYAGSAVWEVWVKGTKGRGRWVALSSRARADQGRSNPYVLDLDKDVYPGQSLDQDRELHTEQSLMLPLPSEVGSSAQERTRFALLALWSSELQEPGATATPKQADVRAGLTRLFGEDGSKWRGDILPMIHELAGLVGIGPNEENAGSWGANQIPDAAKLAAIFDRLRSYRSVLLRYWWEVHSQHSEVASTPDMLDGLAQSNFLELGEQLEAILETPQGWNTESDSWRTVLSAIGTEIGASPNAAPVRDHLRIHTSGQRLEHFILRVDRGIQALTGADLRDLSSGSSIAGVSAQMPPIRNILKLPGLQASSATLDALAQVLESASLAPVPDSDSRALLQRTLTIPKFDSENLYCVRCWAKVIDPKNPCVLPTIVWSARSEAFKIADPNDLLGQRPVHIPSPNLKAMLRDIPKMFRAGATPFSFVSTPEGSGVDTGRGLEDWKKKGELMWICAFGLPLHTLIALILFALIYSILIWIPGFLWLLLLKICIPFGRRS